jgi:polyphenol oxidase
VSAGRYTGLNLGAHVGDAADAVAENRRRLTERLGRPVVYMDQCHGAEVAVVSGVPDVPPSGDALVTTSTAVALAVLVADCVPVLLADSEAGVVAAVHAGREGVRQGVLPAALSAMASLGARARHVTALLGPAVCGACYEVPEQMQADVARVAPSAAVRTRAGTPGLDLRAGVEEILRRAGIPEVVQDPRCTVEDPQLFSHRRDGITGRQAGIVWLD